jgi:hypothetical protein
MPSMPMSVAASVVTPAIELTENDAAMGVFMA